jgi:predicted transcriptional regulator
MKTTPYFYVLREVSTGNLYAGVKFARGCKPCDLLTTYFTSSKIVKRLLATNPQSFVIDRIKIFPTKEEAIAYEKRFLSKVKAHKSAKWYNQSISGAVHPDLLKSIYNEKYQVDNPKQLQEIKDKAADTCMERFNAPSRFEASDFEQKRKDSMLLRYGVEYTTQSPELLAKIRKSYLDKYGVDNPSKMLKNRLLHSRLMKEKNTTRKVCEHCGKESNYGNYARWHGDSCRHKTPATV